MWSCQPWKWPLKRSSTSRPVKARASRTAISVASVPEEVKRSRSADGTRRWMARAQAISRGWLAPNWVPSPAASAHRGGDARMAMAEDQRAVAAVEVDVAVAVDVPFVRPGGAGDIDAVGIDMAGVVGDAAGQQDRRGLAGQLARARRALAIGGTMREFVAVGMTAAAPACAMMSSAPRLSRATSWRRTPWPGKRDQASAAADQACLWLPSQSGGLAGLLAGAEPDGAGLFRLVFQRREAGALVAAVAERLAGAAAAGAPPIRLAGLDIDLDRCAAGDNGRSDMVAPVRFPAGSDRTRAMLRTGALARG